MAAPSPQELVDLLDQLRREVADLKRRIVALERLVGTSSEHATDRTVVQGKVSYDWQQ
jgi:hypothetical protein